MVKESTVNAGDARDMGSIPGLERSPGEGNGNSLQYSWQKKKKKNPMDRGSWQATGHRIAKSQTQLSTQSLKKKMHVKSRALQTKKHVWLKLFLNFCRQINGC